MVKVSPSVLTEHYDVSVKFTFNLFDIKAITSFYPVRHFCSDLTLDLLGLVLNDLRLAMTGLDICVNKS